MSKDAGQSQFGEGYGRLLQERLGDLPWRWVADRVGMNYRTFWGWTRKKKHEPKIPFDIQVKLAAIIDMSVDEMSKAIYGKSATFPPSDDPDSESLRSRLDRLERILSGLVNEFQQLRRAIGD